jgi:hypothetical protein
VFENHCEWLADVSSLYVHDPLKESVLELMELPDASCYPPLFHEEAVAVWLIDLERKNIVLIFWTNEKALLQKWVLIGDYQIWIVVNAAFGPQSVELLGLRQVIGSIKIFLANRPGLLFIDDKFQKSHDFHGGSKLIVQKLFFVYDLDVIALPC